MHISDGVLTAPVLIGGYAGTAILTGLTLRNIDQEDIPKISVTTAVFFVASLIHVPIGLTSIHLILNGLVGVILGIKAFPAILLGIILQTILFGHGGVTVIGVNTMMLGGGGLFAYFIWQIRHKFSSSKKRDVFFGAMAGAFGIIFSGIILSLALVTTGEGFLGAAGYALAAHVPIMIIEGIVVAVCVGFLHKVKPDALSGYRK